MSLITVILVKSALVLLALGFDSVVVRCFFVWRMGDEARKLFLIFFGLLRGDSGSVLTFKTIFSPFLDGNSFLISWFC